MRIRKHRAWHREAKKMLYDSSANIFKWIEEGQPIDIMDYCGLKDKNGKEIYDGDILTVNGGENKYEVIWQSNACQWMLQKTTGGRDYYDYFEWRYQKDFEIIGNIYENPEINQ